MDLFAYLVAKRAAGGTGGTDDYRDLTNKPKINNHTLDGNQTAADLGLSTFSGSYTDLTDKPTLGTAAAKGVDSAPTTSSANLVESGGVASALAGKQATLTTAQQAAVDSGITAAKVSTYDGYATSKLSAADVFGRGTQIPAETDLDDWKTIGRYYSSDKTRTNSLVNKPFSNTGFDLEVRQSYQSQSGTDGINQIAYTVSGGVFTVKVRTYRYSGSPAAWSWTDWQTLAFTAAT